MRCESYALPGGGGIFICGTPSKADGPPCGCGARSVALCDFPLSGKAAGVTCSRPVCARCGTRMTNAVELGLDGVQVDFCPAHRAWTERWRAKGGGPLALPPLIRTRLASFIEAARQAGLTTTAAVLEPLWEALDKDLRGELGRVRWEVKRRFRAARRASKDPARGRAVGDPPARVYAVILSILRPLRVVDMR